MKVERVDGSYLRHMKSNNEDVLSSAKVTFIKQL